MCPDPGPADGPGSLGALGSTIWIFAIIIIIEIIIIIPFFTPTIKFDYCARLARFIHRCWPKILCQLFVNVMMNASQVASW